MFIWSVVFVDLKGRIEGHLRVNVVVYLVFLGDHTDLLSFLQL